ncbi:hypothetical protein J6590_036887 [Homalodisca vitripennis]|nr:hypothetical protein J6590_036887 [Homalodisca vitripennis]
MLDRTDRKWMTNSCWFTVLNVIYITASTFPGSSVSNDLEDLKNDRRRLLPLMLTCTTSTAAVYPGSSGSTDMLSHWASDNVVTGVHLTADCYLIQLRYYFRYTSRSRLRGNCRVTGLSWRSVCTRKNIYYINPVSCQVIL